MKSNIEEKFDETIQKIIAFAKDKNYRVKGLAGVQGFALNDAICGLHTIEAQRADNKIKIELHLL
ncbi:hypothetical protein FW778_07715 [Ginsengibacter hankyongi]|uniref:Uncharacterized protein n=1 Tax=Ginsengibacter hankyongi TaxID=2607284 RepID=A0A5J5INJ0_9BACT|nr:hypothetical protein [Ginsengibacter hankyongi]KAA9041893.1 hypothetical protein FW778_07715 [Ginsengibacter hankyongi]